MTAERSLAYGRVVALLGDAGLAALEPEERLAVREAADALLFTAGPTVDRDARTAVDLLDDLADRLVMFERLDTEVVEALLRAVSACGPRVPAAA